MSKRNRRSVATDKVEDEESKPFDVLWASLVTAIILGSFFMLAVFSKFGIYVYKTTDSIVYAIMSFIFGIILVLGFLLFLATIGDYIELATNYLALLLVCFLIIEMILGLISLF